jgi:hypothetical protein
MSSSLVAFRPHHKVRLLASPELEGHWFRRRVAIAWGLLMLNVLTFDPGQSVLGIPSAVGKGITQGALSLALVLALTVNPRLRFRPNVFLVLMTILVAGTILPAFQPESFGTVYRTVRFAEFVLTLWLLTPFWGRRDMLLVRAHLTAMGVMLVSVVVGLFIDPGKAIGTGRLVGSIWPAPAPQVAHYAAVTAGLVAVLWLGGHARGRATLVIFCGSMVVLVLTHTRTALVSMVAGLLIAGISLVVVRARARRFFAVAGGIATIAIVTLSGFITAWLARGEGSTEITDLSGRTLVWTQVLAFPRDKFQDWFGFGLSNASFNGLPIDSNWIASYQEQGLFGVFMCASVLLFLLVTSWFQPSGVRRALALFLVVYCMLASLTEVGFTDASPYLLDLTVAASLIIPAPGNGNA